MGDVVMANQAKVDTSATESMVPCDVEVVITCFLRAGCLFRIFDRPRNPGKSFLWYEQFAILTPTRVALVGCLFQSLPMKRGSLLKRFSAVMSSVERSGCG